MQQLADKLQQLSDKLAGISRRLEENIISLKDCQLALASLKTNPGNTQMQKLLWRTVDGNILWLRAVMSRHTNPSSFTQAMMPERNALISDRQFAEVLNWIKQTEFPASYLGEGIVVFNTEEDVTAFLLRWG